MLIGLSSLVLLVVGHLFLMTPLGRSWAGLLICLAGFGGAVFDTISPLLIRYGSGSWSYPKLLSFGLLELSLVFMCVWTIGCLLQGSGPKPERPPLDPHVDPAAIPLPKD